VSETADPRYQSFNQTNGQFPQRWGYSGFDRLQVCKYHRTIAKSGDFPHQPQQIVDVLQNMNGKQIVIGS
jgi:hypothetical protein